MKIGILTLPFNNNYGGYLQAYALMTVLKQNGQEVELIYRKHNKRPLKWRVKYIIKNTINILLGREHGSLIPNQEKELRKKGQLMMLFVDKYIIPRTKPLYSSEALKQHAAKRYDAIIVGSDQVWRPDYVPDVENFFLTFLSDDTKRIAYAASFGTDKPVYSSREKEQCGQGFEWFHLVTIREKSAIQVINDFGWKSRKSPIQVLDPTMLLSKKHYESLIDKETLIMKGKMLCYVLDSSENTQKLIENVSMETGLEPINFLDKDHWKKTGYVLPSIESWLAAFRDAEFVVTDSFHGTVFSIIFNKPFVAYANAERGADRFDSLLSQFYLTDCLYSEGKSYQHIDINWKIVNDILEKRRNESSALLKSSL